MSCLGVNVCTTVDDPADTPHLEIEGVEATDAQGGIVCQSSLTVRLGDAAPLALDLRLAPDDLEPVFSGAAWAGTVLWRAAAILADRALLAPATRISVEGRSVVELGAGLGVPGMVAARLGASRVALTEQPSLVELLERNAAANFDKPPAVVEFSWSRAGADALKRDFNDGAPIDVVICCDCVYEPLYGTCWIELLEALDALRGRPRGEKTSRRRRARRNLDATPTPRSGAS